MSIIPVNSLSSNCKRCCLVCRICVSNTSCSYCISLLINYYCICVCTCKSTSSN
nr:MAG TPA: hypothetical protein [Caudoviricetes sp.]